MDGGVEIGTGFQDGGMEDAGAANLAQAFLAGVALEIVFFEPGSGHFLEEGLGRLHQEGIGLAGDAQTDMVMGEVGNALVVHQPVGRRQFDAGLPFVGADRIPEGGRAFEDLYRHGSSRLLPPG